MSSRATILQRRRQRAKRTRHDTTTVLFNIERDWDEISLRFRQMFGGLGVLDLSEHLLEFCSQPPAVPTGISLDRQGRLLANMPLHSIESSFTTVFFDGGLTFLRLEGPGASYTYTVPSEILALRVTSG
ncbi:MAG: hypothetical protein QF880_03295 [Candidatus Poseidonia sp.]|nr:hypothetical protein [Poseidonia sp.]